MFRQGRQERKRRGSSASTDGTIVPENGIGGDVPGGETVWPGGSPVCVEVEGAEAPTGVVPTAISPNEVKPGIAREDPEKYRSRHPPSPANVQIIAVPPYRKRFPPETHSGPAGGAVKRISSGKAVSEIPDYCSGRKCS